MEERSESNNVTGPDHLPVAKPSSAAPQLHTQPTAPAEVADPIRPIAESPSPQEKPRQRPRGYAFKSLLSTFQLVLGAVVLAVVINHFVFQSYQVFGQSMVPTLHEGDRLIINKLGKSWASVFGDGYLPKRGDIIVFHNPNDAQIQLVKRVIGLPGDRIVVDNGDITVYTDDSPLGFDYDLRFGLDLGSTVGEVDINVPAGEVFVVGDNRTPGGSLDSRNELGTVPAEEIVGDLAFRIFPVEQARSF